MLSMARDGSNQTDYYNGHYAFSSERTPSFFETACGIQVTFPCVRIVIDRGQKRRRNEEADTNQRADRSDA